MGESVVEEPETNVIPDSDATARLIEQSAKNNPMLFPFVNPFVMYYQDGYFFMPPLY